MPTRVFSLGGDGGGTRGSAAALGTITMSPVIEPAIRQMTTELAQTWLAAWSPEFQANAGVLGSMLLMLIIGWAAVKIAHLTRGAEG